MATKPVPNITDLIGDTPMVKLTRLAPDIRSSLYGKLEFMNPGGSIKDRPALGMILEAEKAGHIKPGDTIIEPTAGNTGIGLALVGVRRGYKVILVVPEKFSVEKTKVMEALGAVVVHTPTSEGMEGAIKQCYEIKKTIPRSFIPQQFENFANPDSHYHTTGKEIYEALDGKIDAVVIGAGTGGTFTGVARYIKERNPEARAYIADPVGSILGGGEKGAYETEGIGSSFFPDVLDMKLADGVIAVSDEDSFRMVAKLARREGILAGISSGANAEAAVRVARGMPAGSNIVTIFPDGSERYISKNIFRYAGSEK